MVFPELSQSGFSVGEIDADVSLELDDKRLHELGERTDAGVLLGFPERKHFLPGQTSRAYPVLGGRHRAATLVCNDAWQPQLAFLSVQDGATILLVPAASGQSSFPEHYNAREYWEGIARFYGRWSGPPTWARRRRPDSRSGGNDTSLLA